MNKFYVLCSVVAIAMGIMMDRGHWVFTGGGRSEIVEGPLGLVAGTILIAFGVVALIIEIVSCFRKKSGPNS